jgi:hypothetical protein
VNIGFTGTRQGMTKWQAAQVRQFLESFDGDRFLHGNCLGADTMALLIAQDLGYHTVAYPVDVPDWQNDTFPSNTVMEMDDQPLRRNRHMLGTVIL